MTVAELIEELKKLPPDVPVMHYTIEYGDDSWREITTVELLDGEGHWMTPAPRWVSLDNR